MGANRVFLSQDTLDKWLSEERALVEGETMTALPERHRFELKSAVHFIREVAGGGDEPALVGKVKDLEQLAEMGAEHYADSVIMGDNAYEVVEGFVGMPVHDGAPALAPPPAAPDKQSGEIELLARFFLSSK